MQQRQCSNDTRQAAHMDDELDHIVAELKCSHFLLEFQRSLQTEVRKPSIYSGELKKHVKKYIKDSGYAVQFQNIIFKVFNEKGKADACNKEPLDYLKKAQRNWEKCIIKSINSMCTELSLPLARKRNLKDQKDLAQKFEAMSLGAEYNDGTYEKLRPVYSAADYFEVVTGVKNNNCDLNRSPFKSWYLIQAQLYTPEYEDIKQFKQMTSRNYQVGIDDTTNSVFASDWLKVGQKLVSKGHMGASKQYLKQGCLPGLRKHIWKILFDINLSDLDKLHYEQLKDYVFEYDMLVDYLIMKDVRLTATNDDSFFVFEDVLYQILLVFSRDTSIIDHFSYSSATPPKSYIRGQLGIDEYAVNYPPCGIFPFHGFSMLAAPLCYVYEKPVEIYFVFRHLYTRYFFRLHTISSDPQGIVSLCTFFEKLLQNREASLFKYLLDIGVQPLTLVFNWFLFAYSGYLATDETLQLWDRILGYDSLFLLPILAVAILSYRKENLLSVTTASACEAILADVSTIKVIPILVNFLSGRAF